MGWKRQWGKAKDKVKKVYDTASDAVVAAVDIVTLDTLDLNNRDDDLRALVGTSEKETISEEAGPDLGDFDKELTKKRQEERAKLRDTQRSTPGRSQSILTRRNSMDSILG